MEEDNIQSEMDSKGNRSSPSTAQFSNKSYNALNSTFKSGPDNNSNAGSDLPKKNSVHSRQSHFPNVPEAHDVVSTGIDPDDKVPHLALTL